MHKPRINWFKILVYASLVFLVIALIRKDMLFWPKVTSPLHFWLSLLPLFTAFFLLGFRWQKILKHSRLPINLSDAIISCGLSIFAKYIPGKLLMVIGKTGHIKNRYSYSSDKLFTASFNDQIIALWSGLLFGSFSLFFLQRKFFFILALVVWVFLSLAVFTSLFHNMLAAASRRFLKKDWKIQAVPLPMLIGVLPWHFLYWACIGFGFYLLTKGLVAEELLSPLLIFAFPFAVVLGILSLISPGGLGVREAVLVAFFASTAHTDYAVMVSASSRLWFLAGEIFLFIFAVLFNLNKRKELSKEKHAK